MRGAVKITLEKVSNGTKVPDYIITKIVGAITVFPNTGEKRVNEYITEAEAKELAADAGYEVTVNPRKGN